ncbi:MAG: DUF1294 domain-containing protein [Clostridia bacterium]|nr:DUF1294 domain-containing protein [Clostridia bacterium]
MLLKILIGYLIAISLVSVVVCVYDKFAAKHAQKHRTREATLLLLSALGGSVAMLATMLLIRHKTKHVKFMLGIPMILLAQAAAVYWIVSKL